MAGPVPSADTFPTTDLQCRVWIALTPDYSLPWWQWGWADITEHVRWDPGVTVSDGRRDESGTVSTINASMVLENDGRFSRRNAFGPYYGFLTRNTPIWAQVNPGSGWYDRLHGYVNAWPKRWDTTGTDSIAPISIGGIKRRIDSDDTEKSAMARTCSSPTGDGFEPIAYWPMEDGVNATQFASALPGGQVAILGGVTDLAVSDVVPGSLPLPTWPSGAVSQGVVPAYTDTGRWAVQIASHMPTNAESVTSGVVRAFCENGDVIVGPNSAGTQITTVVRDASETIVATDSTAISAALVLDQNLSYVITAVDNASGTDDYFYVRVFNSDGDIVLSADVNAGAGIYGRVTDVYPGGRFHNFTGMTIGHLQVFVDAGWDEDTSGVPGARAMGGWNGELADERIARVCREETIPFATYSGSETAALGPQPTGTTSAVLADAEKADRGVLYEHEFGLAYKSPRDYYNQPVHLTIDQAQGQLAESVEADDDDQDYVNQWTASRVDGSSATFRDPDFDTNYEALFAGGDTYNVETDEQLPHIAGWEVHKGTVDEDRWPVLAIDLANHPELIGEWTAMPFGGRAQVDNPHEEVGVDLIDAIREGRAEHWNSKQWNARMNTTPASIHTVAVYDDNVSRYGAGDSTLSAAVSDSATSWTVDPGTDTWATTGSHPDVFPLDIDTGGLTYACTAITGAVTDTFTRSETDGWGDADTGQTWTLSGGTNPGNYDVDGTQGTHTLDSVNVRRHSFIDTSDTDFDAIADVTLPVVPTGAAITLWLAGRVTNTSNYYAAYLSVATSGTVTLVIGERVAGSSADLLSATAGTHSAGDTWRIRFQGVGRGLRAKAWNTTTGSEPGGWLVETWDDSLTTGTSVGLLSRLETGNTNGTVTVAWDNLHTVLAPLTFTVTRLATDKTHAAGTAVTVTDTGVYGI